MSPSLPSISSSSSATTTCGWPIQAGSSLAAASRASTGIAAPADQKRPLARHRRLGLRRRIEERLDLVAQMVVARIVGGRDLARVRAGADDHRRPQPVAQLQGRLLDQASRQRHRRHHQRPAGQHPQAREIDLEQVEQRQVEQERPARDAGDVAHLLPQLPPARIVAEMLEHHQAAQHQNQPGSARAPRSRSRRRS